ncbi:MAG: hypothetical protein ACLPM8_09550 [Myxococcaceae bacterium]
MKRSPGCTFGTSGAVEGVREARFLAVNVNLQQLDLAHRLLRLSGSPVMTLGVVDLEVAAVQAPMETRGHRQPTVNLRVGFTACRS